VLRRTGLGADARTADDNNGANNDGEREHEHASTRSSSDDCAHRAHNTMNDIATATCYHITVFNACSHVEGLNRLPMIEYRLLCVLSSSVSSIN
jgi:hypothetical protein